MRGSARRLGGSSSRGVAPRALTGFVVIIALCLWTAGAGSAWAARLAAASGAAHRSDLLFSPLTGLPGGVRPEAPVYLILNVAACRLYVYIDGRLSETYPAAVGRVSAPTPTGLFAIISKHVNPIWLPPNGPPVPPGPSNPLGTRWMGFTWRGHGLHGNNAPWLIGRPASAGCVRLHNEHSEALFELVRLGTPLLVLYEPVELAVNDSGKPGFSLTLHPDIYGRVDDYPAHIASRLALAGLAAAPAEVAWLTGAVAENGSVTWDTAWPLDYQGRRVESEVIILRPSADGGVLVALDTLAENAGLTLCVDSVSGTVSLDDHVIENTVLVAGRVFALLEHIPVVAALDHPAGGRLLPIHVRLYVLPEKAVRDTEGFYVPIRALAAVLSLPLVWDDARGTVAVLGHEMPVRVLDGTAYVRVENLGLALTGFVTVTAAEDGVYIAR